jgi:hypothetical protein
MSRKAKKVSQPIQNEESLDLSDSQKLHYANLGYKPYLSHSGKVKWLSDDQHAFEIIKYANRNKKLTLNKIHLQNRKTAKQFRGLLKILKHNWFLLLLLLIGIYILFHLTPIMTTLSNLNI